MALKLIYSDSDLRPSRLMSLVGEFDFKNQYSDPSLEEWLKLTEDIGMNEKCKNCLYSAIIIPCSYNPLQST